MQEIARTCNAVVYAYPHGKYVEKVFSIDNTLDAIIEIINCVTIKFLHRLKPTTNLCIYTLAIKNNFICLRAPLYDGSLDCNLKWSTTDIITICQQIGNAIAFLHSYGILHRDIKPGNILFNKNQMKFVLADFGSAKCINKFTVANETIFLTEERTTKAFQAPELLLNPNAYSEQTDAWSYGVLIFYLRHNVELDTSRMNDYTTFVKYINYIYHHYTVTSYMNIDPHERPLLIEKYPHECHNLNIDDYIDKLTNSINCMMHDNVKSKHIAEYLYHLYFSPRETIVEYEQKIETISRDTILHCLTLIPPLEPS
jgi:serine/threonine protein kinase